MTRVTANMSAYEWLLLMKSLGWLVAHCRERRDATPVYYSAPHSELCVYTDSRGVFLSPEESRFVEVKTVSVIVALLVAEDWPARYEQEFCAFADVDLLLLGETNAFVHNSKHVELLPSPEHDGDENRILAAESHGDGRSERGDEGHAR